MKRVYTAFTIFLACYAAIYLIIDDAPLYWVGGIIVGSLAELLNINSQIAIWISLLILLGIILLYFKIRSKPVRYAIILALFIMLYLIDILFSGLVTYDKALKGVLVLSVLILIKSSILAYLIYRGKRLNA